MSSREQIVIVATTPVHSAIFNTVVEFQNEKEWEFQQIDGGKQIRKREAHQQQTFQCSGHRD